MNEGDNPSPEGGDAAIEAAIGHLHEAEHDLVQAQDEEVKAKRELALAR
jgi:hypothetical protein